MPGVAGRFTPEARRSSSPAAAAAGADDAVVRHGEDGVSPYGGRLYPKIAQEVDKVKALVSDASPLFSRGEHIRGEEMKRQEDDDAAGGVNGTGRDWHLAELPEDAELPGGSLLAKGIYVAEKLISSKFRSLLLSSEPHTAAAAAEWGGAQAVSWHRRNLWLAFISSDDQVVIQDFEDASFRDQPTVLSAEAQKGVGAIEWRPNAGATLCVGCRGGTCIWTAAHPGTIAPVRTTGGGSSHHHHSSGSSTLTGSGPRWVLVDVLLNQRTPGGGGAPVTAVSWSPCGRLLATASAQEAAYTVWDVSLGQGTPLRRGLDGVSVLKWAPSGDYVVSAKVSGAFHLWESYTWTSQPWTTSQGGLSNAAWSPDGRVLLAAFDRSPALAAFHFAARPPSLEVHWLPVELPGLASVMGVGGGSGGCCVVDKMAWDGSGKRLAVSCRPPAGGGDGASTQASGRVAIYDVRQAPLVSASFLGVVAAPEPGTRPVAFAFHATKKQGTLFSVCWSNGYCVIYTMLFGS